MHKKIDFISSMLSGIIISFLMVMVTVSFTQFIFHGKLSSYFPVATYLILITTVIITLVTALFSSLPISIGHPQDEPLPIIALAISSIVAGIQNPDNLFSTTMVVIACSTSMTGICFYMIGKFKLGNFIRFIPFPVVVGFLVSVGCLLIIGTTKNIMSILPNPLIYDSANFFKSDFFMIWSITIGYTLLFFYVMYRFTHRLTFPGFLLFSIVMFYIIVFVFHISIPMLREHGLLFQPFPPPNTLMSALSQFSFSKVEWDTIYPQIGNLITIIPISTISFLLILGALDFNLKKEIDLNRELCLTGINNTFIGFAGGLVGYTGFMMTIINNHLKSTTRAPGILSAIFTLAILLVGMNLIAYIPKIIVFGMLLFIGISILKTWGYDIKHEFYSSDYLTVFIILIMVLSFGLLAGVIVGILVSFVLIVINYSQISPIKYRIEGTNVRSGTRRDNRAKNILKKEKGAILFLKLQNYLFFGITNKLIDDIKITINNQPNQLRYIIYDYELVIGIDSSALYCFSRIKAFIKEHNITAVITEVEDTVLKKLMDIGFIDPNDPSIIVVPQHEQAIEWCEKQILHKNNYVKNEALPLEAQLTNLFQNETTARCIKKYFNKIAINEQEFLFKQGELASSLYYLESGELSVYMATQNKKQLYISTIQTGNIIGEMGFYLMGNRFATIIANENSIVEELSAENFAKMCTEEPAIAEQFNRVIVRILAERLNYRNLQI
ncbi:SLC26A/SulP transporter family protein [Legionella cincinnatiensis]|nr:SulP family inorganic anion transporter [Legionella cincinnatiensis]